MEHTSPRLNMVITEKSVCFVCELYLPLYTLQHAQQAVDEASCITVLTSSAVLSHHTVHVLAAGIIVSSTA